MTKALLDINLVLDYVLLRVPFAQDAITIWDALQRGTFAGFVSAITAPTIFYVVRRQSGISSARKAIQHILTALHTCPVDHAVLHHALSLPFADFEDAVQVASAVAAGLDLIVTRDSNDFRDAPLPVLTPGAFIARSFT